MSEPSEATTSLARSAARRRTAALRRSTLVILDAQRLFGRAEAFQPQHDQRHGRRLALAQRQQVGHVLQQLCVRGQAGGQVRGERALGARVHALALDGHAQHAAQRVVVLA